ncbi:MAG: hypothetical protein ACE5D4_08445 [Thermodesulfobacteriota bacterium]
MQQDFPFNATNLVDGHVHDLAMDIGAFLQQQTRGHLQGLF